MTELFHILPGKLDSPHLGFKTLVRARLYQQIDQSLAGFVTTIVAPAGYGKTVLLTNWMAQQTLPAAWFSLDENDNHLLTFARYLALAIEKLFPASCRETLSLVNGLLPPNLSQLTDSFLAEIGDLPKSTVLVLDDYHVLVNPEIHTLIASLIDHLPEHLHLIIGSRSVPPLPLARWRLNGQLGEIRASDLRFTLMEGGEFLQLLLDIEIPSNVNKAIAERTEGWAAGLRLTALTLQGQADLSKLSRDLLEHQRYIMDYLMDEVFSRQPSALRALLLSSSILDWMSPSLLTQLMNAEVNIGVDFDRDAEPASLAQLLKAGLFIDQVDGSGNIYRYHALFRDLLRQRLKARTTPQAIAALHREASCWLSENGYYEDAVRHALAAGDPLMAAKLVEGQIHPLLNRESKLRLARLLDLLPPQLCEERAPLLIARAWVMHFEHRLFGISPWLQRAAQRLPHTEDLSEVEVSRWRGDILTMQSEEQFWRNNPSEALNFGSQAVAVTASASYFVRGLAVYYQGLSLHAIGDPIMAERLLRQHLQESTPASVSADTRLLLGLCVLYHDTLQIDQLQSNAQLLLHLAEASGFLISQAWGHYFLGIASYEKNDLDTAQIHFLAGVGLRNHANGIATHECLVGLALIYAAQERWQRADETATKLIEFDSMPLSEERLRNAQSLQVRLAIMRGDLDLAWRCVDRSEPEDLYTPAPLLEMAEITRVWACLATNILKDTQQALGQAQQLQRKAESTSSTLRIVKALILQALALDASDDVEKALRTLHQAIELMQRDRIIRIFVDFGPALGGLLNRLLRSGLVTHPETANYAAQLFAAFPTEPDALPISLSGIEDNLIEPLTSREGEVLELLAHRLTDREIAETLVISPHTVRRHVRNISEKMGESGRRAVVERARNLGLLPPVQFI